MFIDFIYIEEDCFKESAVILVNSSLRKKGREMCANTLRLHNSESVDFSF